MDRISHIMECLKSMEDDEYIVETLKSKYGKMNTLNRKTDVNYIRFPYDYFADLKFFLERQNAPAVRTLLIVICEVFLEENIGKSELREFKNALIIFMTLFVNMMLGVYGDANNQTVAFSKLVSKIEEIDDTERLKTLVLEEMLGMIRAQNDAKSDESYSYLVQEALEIIQRQFREKIRVKSLAMELSISESYLSRCFKKETGYTLSEYVLKLRIDEAKQLLTKTDASVHDIAIAVGFNYQNHFASVFKKYTGKSPLGYRKNCF